MTCTEGMYNKQIGETVEDYPTQMATLASQDMVRIAMETSEEGIFMLCMMGQLCVP